MIAILEDNEDRIKGFLEYFKDKEVFHTKDPNDFIKFVKANVGLIDLMCLDHDLGFFEYTPYCVEVTGAHVCEALAQMQGMRSVHIIIHSANPSGADNMQRILNKAEIYSERRRFPWWI